MSASLKRLWSDLEDTIYVPRKRFHDALVLYLGFRDQSPPPQSANWPGRLPDDVLFEIFSLIIEDYFSHSDALLTSAVTPQLTLGAVCRQWRLALRETRSVWTSIPAGASPGFVTSSYHRARGLPLRVGIEFTLPDLCSTGPWSRARLQQELLRQFDARFSLPTPQLNGQVVNFRNVRELAVSSSSYALAELIAQNLWHKRTFPDVDTLYVAFQATAHDISMLPANLQHLYRHDGHAAFYSLYWTHLFPSLRKLRLDGAELSTWSLNLPVGLRHLAISLMCDEERDILGITPANARSLAFLFRDLSSLPNLEYLSLDFDGLSLKSNAQHTDEALLSTLHSLHEINITAVSPSPFYLISCASLPALRRVALNLRYHNFPCYHTTGTKLEIAFFNYLRQLAASGVHLRSVYVGHHGCSSSLKSAISFIASTELVDWTDASAVRAFCDAANVHCTVSWDPDTHASDTDIAGFFLNALLCCIPAHVSDTHPIQSLAFSDDGGLSTYFFSEQLLMRMPCVHTLVCYGSDGPLIDALRGCKDAQYLKTFIAEGGVECDGMAPPSHRYDLGISQEPVEVRFIGSEPGRIMRNAVMKVVA